MTLTWPESVVLMMVQVLVLLPDSNSAGVRTLPPPTAVSMDSVDMRHTLRWRPLQVPCNTSVLYSVQFQGEFELTVLNGSWVDAPECQLIHHPHCDLTLDLGSDSDYSVRVRARCGTQLSTWAALSRPFNRRDSVLTVPGIKVSTMGNGFRVSFDKVPPSAVVKVTVWRSDDELKADVYSVAAERTWLDVAALQEGVKYCVRAQIVLENQVRSGSTDAHCDVIAASDSTWKTVTAVTVTVVLMAVLMSAVFLAVVHCRTYFHNEPQPLPWVWEQKPITCQQKPITCQQDPEVCDCIDSMQRVTLKTDDDDDGGECPIPVDVVVLWLSRLDRSRT